jgi:hypothetical protein
MCRRSYWQCGVVAKQGAIVWKTATSGASGRTDVRNFTVGLAILGLAISGLVLALLASGAPAIGPAKASRRLAGRCAAATREQRDGLLAVGNKDGTAMRLADDGDELRALAIDSLVGTTSG